MEASWTTCVAEKEKSLEAQSPSNKTGSKEPQDKTEAQLPPDVTEAKAPPNVTEAKLKNGKVILEYEIRLEGEPWKDKAAKCEKNKGHKGFLPVTDFLKDPSSLLTQNGLSEKQKHLLRLYVYHVAQVTVRITSFFTSDKRPKVFPGTEKEYPPTNMFSTGFLASGFVPQEGKCPRSRCKILDKSHKHWICLVRTATHCLCDPKEADQSQLEFYNIGEIMKGVELNDASAYKPHNFDLEDYEKTLEKHKITIYGTSITVGDFVKRLEDQVHYEEIEGRDIHKKKIFLSGLKNNANNPFATDQNTIVCVTCDENGMEQLSAVWKKRQDFRNNYCMEFADLHKHCHPIVSFPHGGVLLISVGRRFKFEKVSLRKAIGHENEYLEKRYLDFFENQRLYKVKSNTGSSLIPIGCKIKTPRPFCSEDFMADRDNVKVPAQTKVKLIRENGRPERYRLESEVCVPIDSLEMDDSLYYCSYDTPTCPGSSGALVWESCHWLESSMAHSYAEESENENNNHSGIEVH